MDNSIFSKYTSAEIENFFEKNFEFFESEYSIKTYKIEIKRDNQIFKNMLAFKWRPETILTDDGYRMPKNWEDLMKDIAIHRGRIIPDKLEDIMPSLDFDENKEILFFTF